MVYVSTPSLALTPRNAVMQSQSDLSKAQQELSTGKLADVGLGLGSQSGQLVGLAQASNRLQSYIDTNATATTRLQATTSALNSIQSTASGFLATLATANASSPSISSLVLASQNNVSAMVSTLNSSVGGQYIFAGINTDVAPLTVYASDPPSAAKTAVDDSFTATFGFSPDSPAAASVSGTDMQTYLDTQFASLFSPSSFSGTWSAATDQTITTQIADNETVTTSVSANEAAFRKLSQAYTMIGEFAGKGLSTAAVQAVTRTATNLVNGAISGMVDLNAGAGISLNAITDSNERATTQKNLLDTQVASMQGVDSYALSTRISSLQIQVQASYELTSKLQAMSLVNYLS